MKIYLKEEGARYDALEAVLNKDSDDFLLIARRVESLIAFINTHDGMNFVASVKRTANILENEFQKSTTIANEINPELFVEKEEKQLYHAICEVEKRFLLPSMQQIYHLCSVC